MENIDISKNNFPRLLGMISLNNFALSFVSIFVPVYLLKLGYSFQMIMVWFIIHHSMIVLFAFLTVFVSNKIGLVKCLHIRSGLIFLYFLLLLFALKENSILFFILPVISGAEAAFYWMPLNILYVRNTKPKEMGSAMSKLMAFPKAISMAGPIIGALIIAQFGFNSVFALSMTLLAFTFIPILSLSSEKTNFLFTWEKTKDIWRRNKKFFVPEIVDNLAEDAMALWSIFIYLSLLNTLEVGIIGTITSLASLFFVLTIGKLTDNWDKHKLLKIGAVLVSLVWIANFFIGEYIPNQWLFYIATIAATLSLKVFIVPYSAILWNNARKDDAQFIVLREIPTVLGRIILFILAIILHKNIPLLFLLVGLIFLYFVFTDTKKLETSS